ncbi:MAG: SMC-Scp complex subunit ScpB [Wenzhouxiangellaceae bacterium]
MEPEKLKIWLEGALLAAGQPLTLAQLNGLFDEDEQPGHGTIREALAALDAELVGRAVELVEVAGGYRLQIRQNLMPVISRLWAEKPPRYSRALLETLAIVAYRQPITRSEIEQIRGVSLSANILKTLQEREWIKVVGHRDIPGKPELLGTTKVFLDYFGLKGLDDLPTLAEIRDLDNIEPELELNDPEHAQAANDDQQQTAQQDDRQDERQDERQAERTDAAQSPEDDAEDNAEDANDDRDDDHTEEETGHAFEPGPDDDGRPPGPEEPEDRSGAQQAPGTEGTEETDEPEPGQHRPPAGRGTG